MSSSPLDPPPPTATDARRARPWWTGFVCGMASYIDSAAIVSFGIAVVIYQAALGLTPGEVGLISGALTFGIAIGALMGGRLGDRYGRRRVFQATMVLIVVGAGLLVVSSAFGLLLLGSALVGLGTGADLPVSLATISEAASDRNRGKLIGLSQILWFVGIFASIVLATLFGAQGYAGGQILYGHIAVVALVVLVLRFTIPESRSWEAAQTERAAGVATIRADRAALGELVRSPYGVCLAALIIFYSLTNLSANTAGQFGTYLLVNIAGMSVPSASQIGGVAIPVGVVFALWFLAIADGRRRFAYFTVGAVLIVVSPLIIVLLGFTVATYVVSLIVLVAGAGFAGEPIMKFWTQESFPTLLRATAQGTIIAVARFLAAALATVTPLLVEAGARTLFLLLAVVNLAGVAVAWAVFRRRDAHNEFETETQADPLVVEGGR